MTTTQWTSQEETQLVDYLVKRLCDRASGRGEEECVRNYPRDVYFIGNLRPRPDRDQNAEAAEEGHQHSELVNKLAPVAFGAEFRLRPDNSETVTIMVTLTWNCYYRIFPTWEQQKDYQQSQQTATEDGNETEIPSPQTTLFEVVTTGNSADSETAEEPGEEKDYTLEVEKEREDQWAEQNSPEVAESHHDRRQQRRATDLLFPRFRKISCEATGEIIWSQKTSTVDVSPLQTVVHQETAKAVQIARQDSERVRTGGEPHDKVRIPEESLSSLTTYQTVLRSLQTEVQPNWRWEIHGMVRPYEGVSSSTSTEKVVSIEFVNASPQQIPSSSSQPSRRQSSHRRPDHPNIETFLFDTRASFKFTGTQVQPFDLELAPRSFRYDRQLWGRGFNCAVEPHHSSFPKPARFRKATLNTEKADGVETFSTTHTPIYRQMRYVTQETPVARFEDLATNPLPTLRTIVNAMREYQQVWQARKEEYLATNPSWVDTFGNEFDHDYKQFEEEINRFRQGCELIRTKPEVRLAFQLTNETFRRLGDHPHKRKDSWRLFQIVFIISQIPSMVALTDPQSPYQGEREQVDIIYFPTGGGKTEAYLGTIVFHCFFDRLRGKSAGVTAWTRFPLRLLTLQQTQRMADVIGVAELVRRERTEPGLNGPKIDGFAVGYFVGAEGTPNAILNPKLYRYAQPKDSVIWSKANDPKVRQDWKRVITCPSCRTATVQVDFDSNSVRVIHRCTQPHCAFPNGEIPVYVVDNEIYRYLPCVMVGTLDKLANLGNQRMLSQVFGQIDGRCTQHGYYKGKCCQKDCPSDKQKSLLRRQIPPGLSGPTLFVQDELHLLKESLGTFDGHYETFTQQLRREFGETLPLKIMASSATIEKFERQVEHLYGRQPEQARIFPGPGPTLQESFYAKTLEYPQRLFVGLLPHNKTIFNAILEVIELYHREIQQLQNLPAGQANPYGGTLLPGDPAWQELLDKYLTSLTYFSGKRELDSIYTDLQGDVNPNLQRDHLSPLDIHQLTGGTSTEEVTRILEKLEQPAPSKAVADAILATNMVSHGVDIDRLNAMIFYGMPRQNAEYIQASSRVGRSHLGIVFTCLHPIRERDQSHYTYFGKFHEFLGQLVEPVAINRWATFSIQRTLPGLFMAVLLQLKANLSGESNPNRYYMLDFVKQKINEGQLTPEEFIRVLEQAYLLVGDNKSERERSFRNYLRDQVADLLRRQIIAASSHEKFVSAVISPRPMLSLRDVDEPIPIELDNDGSLWSTRINVR